MSMSPNLLNKTIPTDIIFDKFGVCDNSDFIYSMKKGGYCSKDKSVILVTDKKEYEGMLIKSNPDADDERISYWINYISVLFGV